jgi:PST family polysaccharide transporter
VTQAVGGGSIQSGLGKKALGKKATSGVVWSFVREGVAEIMLFPISMLLARILTPEEFGIAAAANFFTLLAIRLSELGFNAAIVRLKEISNLHLSTVFAVNLTLGVANFIALTLAAPLLGAFYGIPGPSRVLSVAAFSFLIAPLGAVPAALLARNLEFRKSTIVDWAQSLAFSGMSLVFAWFGHSYMSMVYGRICAAITSSVLRIWFARWRPSLRFSWPALREILSFGAGVHAKRLLDYTAQQGDNLIVGRVMGMTALGLYDKAFSTMDRFLSRMNTGGPGVMFRIFAVIHEEPDRFRRAYQRVLMSASLVGFPVFAGLIATAPQLILVLFGQQWLASVPAFQLLCITGMLKLLNTYASSAIQATGNVWSEVWRQVLLLAMMTAGIIAFRAWGPTGAAGGVLLATATMSLLMHTLLHRVTHLSWHELLRPLGPAALCAAGVAAVALLVEFALMSWRPATAPLLLLAMQGLLAGLFALGFALFAPHAALRDLVRDVTKDLAPAVIKRQAWAQAYWNARGEQR